MTRLTERQDGRTPEVFSPDIASPDLESRLLAARSYRSAHLGALLRRGFAALTRRLTASSLFSALQRYLKKRRTLQALSRLDDHVLADIGVTRADIEAVATLCCEERLPQEDTAETREPAEVIALSRQRRSLRRSFERDHDHSTAA